MERKIGEIFEYNGEWYQCVESEQDACTDCAFNPINSIGYNCSGSCAYKKVIFKKLEKVGEPFYRRWTLEGNNKLMQRYKIYTTPLITIDKQKMFYNLTDDLLDIEIKKDMEENKLNLKPFDIQKAREGKPVCTRDGRKARIICFDLKDKDYPIVAAIRDNCTFGNEYSETLFCYSIKGVVDEKNESNEDLMMLPEKKEGWIIKPKDYQVYQNKEDAERVCNKDYQVIAKISWEE